jgi:hypothetical protein
MVGVVVENLTVEISMTNGGVASVLRGLSVSISLCVFSNIQTGRIGGAFYLANITNNITILQNKFVNVSGYEDGGAISFNENTTFLINETNFTGCSSINGRGGAVASSSTRAGPRQFYSCLFDQNVAHITEILDMFDSSDNAYTYYTTDSVVRTNSTSSSIGEYILFGATQV